MWRTPLTLFFFACLLLVAHGMPFQPVEGRLQHNRRRAIDYSQDFPPKGARGARAKRSVNYSVVQVDGGSTTTPAASPPPPPPATATVMHTVTPPAPSAVAADTHTVILTTTIAGSESAQTVVITTTKDLTEAIKTPVETQPTTTAAPAVAVTSTVMDVVTSTAMTSQSQAFYDDGLWHTYYPIKSFVPPGYSSLGSFSGVESSTVAAASSSSSTWSSSATPTAQASSWASPQTSPSNSTTPQDYQSRKAPVDVKLASWNVTTRNTA